jgi:hypothetical protein
MLGRIDDPAIFLTLEVNHCPCFRVYSRRTKENDMFDRDKLNPTLAIAIQAKSAEARAIHRRNRIERDDRETAARFRQLAKTAENSSSTGIPTVCTIH